MVPRRRSRQRNALTSTRRASVPRRSPPSAASRGRARPTMSRHPHQQLRPRLQLWWRRLLLRSSPHRRLLQRRPRRHAYPRRHVWPLPRQRCHLRRSLRRLRPRLQRRADLNSLHHPHLLRRGSCRHRRVRCVLLSPREARPRRERHRLRRPEPAPRRAAAQRDRGSSRDLLRRPTSPCVRGMWDLWVPDSSSPRSRGSPGPRWCASMRQTTSRHPVHVSEVRARAHARRLAAVASPVALGLPAARAREWADDPMTAGAVQTPGAAATLGGRAELARAAATASAART